MCVLAAVSAVGATPAAADNWKFSTSVGATETYTSNVNYSPDAISDFVTSLVASVRVDGEGARLKLHGSIGGTALLYARETENNTIVPQVSLAGLLEAIEKFAYLEAQAYVSQTFVSPFGGQPPDLVNATQNRYTQQNYALSPYIQGFFGTSGISYLLRDDNYWTIATAFANNTTPLPRTTYTNQLTASMSSSTKPTGWTLEYIRTYYDNGLGDLTTLGNTFTTQVARLIVPYRPDPQVEIAPRIGYENNDYPLQSSRGVVYGIGGKYSPSERTHLSGYWEHRFFGPSYEVLFTHRLPNSAINASFSRGITTFPQQSLFIPAGANVSQFIDSAFATRISDPAARAQAVAQFLAQTGLPPTLASPLSVYSPGTQLQQNANIQYILIGVRNELIFSVYYLKTAAISGSGSLLPPALQFGQDSRQTGAGVQFNHRLNGYSNLVALARYSRATTVVDTLLNGDRTNNAYASLIFDSKLAPKTTWSAGISYIWTEFPGGVNLGDVRTFNAYVGITHTF